jgi:hypothetical protein
MGGRICLCFYEWGSFMFNLGVWEDCNVARHYHFKRKEKYKTCVSAREQKKWWLERGVTAECVQKKNQ